MSRLRVDVYNDAGPTDPDAKQRQTYIGTEALRREHNKRDLAQARWELKTLGKSGVSERSKEVLKNAGLWKDASDMSRLRVDVYSWFSLPGRGHGWRDANRVVDADSEKDLLAELYNLYHLARTALSESSPSQYERKLWAVKEFVKVHPEISSKRAYLAFERQSLGRDATYRVSRDAEKRASVGGRQTYGQLHDADLSGYTTNQLEVHIREGKSVGSTTIAMFKAELEKRRREGNLYPEKRWGVAKTLSGKPWGEDADSDIAYRGYMIRFNILGKIWVERDGQLISGASNVAGAKKIIDGLVARRSYRTVRRALE